MTIWINLYQCQCCCVKCQSFIWIWTYNRVKTKNEGEMVILQNYFVWCFVDLALLFFHSVNSESRELLAVELSTLPLIPKVWAYSLIPSVILFLPFFFYLLFAIYHFHMFFQISLYLKSNFIQINCGYCWPFLLMFTILSELWKYLFQLLYNLSLFNWNLFIHVFYLLSQTNLLYNYHWFYTITTNNITNKMPNSDKLKESLINTLKWWIHY